MCPQSAKVQLNSGILDRRHSRWDAALAHFEAARRIEPGYCEPAHWIGLTLLAHSSNNITGALSVRLPCLALPLSSHSRAATLQAGHTCCAARH